MLLLVSDTFPVSVLYSSWRFLDYYLQCWIVYFYNDCDGVLMSFTSQSIFLFRNLFIYAHCTVCVKTLKCFSLFRIGFYPIVTVTEGGTGNTIRGVENVGLGRSFLLGGANSPSAGAGTTVKGTHPSKTEGGVSEHCTSAWSQSEDVFTSMSSFLKAAERGARNEVQVWRHSDPIIVRSSGNCWTRNSCETDICTPSPELLWVGKSSQGDTHRPEMTFPCFWVCVIAYITDLIL